jgi:hypothetical protein
MRASFQDPVHGEVTVDHDPTTGAVCIEFERLELADVIMPQYRVVLTTEHVSAWVVHVLSTRGLRCKLAPEVGNPKRLRVMRRVTEKDPSLVYCMPSGAHVVVVRSGCVLKVPFRFVPMTEFVRGLREQGSDPMPTAVAFTNFIQCLLA